MTTFKTTFFRLLSRLPVDVKNPWKMALYVGMFLLPGGTLGIIGLVWLDHRWARRKTQGKKALPAMPQEMIEQDGPRSCHGCA